MKRTGSQTRKRSLALPGQLDLFGAAEVANKSEVLAANDAIAPVKMARIPAPAAAPKASLTTPSGANAANSNTPSKRPRGRPRKVPPLAATHPPSQKAAVSQDHHAEGLRDEWWNSQMVCVFLKISRKTLWERRRARDLNFPQPKLLGGARNLYRASAIREWAEKMADAEF